MRKILIALLVLAVVAGSAVFGITWYGMEQAAHRVVTLNLIYLQQQLQLQGNTVTFEYDAVKPGHHWLSPAVDVYNARVESYVDGKYVTLSVPKVTLVASMHDVRKVDIIIPESVRVELAPDDKLNLNSPDFPLSARTEASEYDDFEAYFFTQWQTTLPQPLELDVSRDGKSLGSEKLSTSLWPRDMWMPIHYRIAEPLNNFLRKLERKY